jgi:hypothetical protein
MTDGSSEHPLKAELPMVTTLEGMKMDSSLVHPLKAELPMFVRLVPRKFTLAKLVHPLKAWAEIPVTEAAKMISLMLEQP